MRILETIPPMNTIGPAMNTINPAGSYRPNQGASGLSDLGGTGTDIAVASGLGITLMALGIANMMSLYYWGKGVGTKNKKMRNWAIGTFVGTYFAPIVVSAIGLGYFHHRIKSEKTTKPYTSTTTNAPNPGSEGTWEWEKMPNVVGV